MNILQKALQLLIGDTPDLSYLKLPKQKGNSKKPTERELIRLESEIGKDLFGPIPQGHNREFFCLDDTTCIWYEEFQNAEGKIETMTTRYEIHDDKVMKVQDGARYSYIDGIELDNLLTAINYYYERVMRSVYNRDPDSGQLLAQ